MRAFLLVLALLATLGAPTAFGHGTPYEAALWAGGQPLDVEIIGAPVVAVGVGMELRVQAPAAGVVDNITAQLTSPSGETGKAFSLDASQQGFVRPVLFSEAGEWRMAITLLPSGNRSETVVRVHPAGPYYVEMDDSTIDRGALPTGREVMMVLRVHDLDEAPPPRADDVKVHVVHEDAGGNLTPELVLPAIVDEFGRIRVQHQWNAAGRLHVRVSSEAWNLSAQDRPPVTLLVVPEGELSVYSAGSRAIPTTAWALVALGLVAMFVRRR